MTTRTSRWVAVVLLAAAAAPARAFVWQGFVGLTYSREDFYEPRVTTPQLDIDLGLSLHGFVYDPNALDYNLGGSYRRTTAGFTQDGGKRAQLDYNLQAILFGNRASPITLNVNANQREDSFGGGGVAGEFSSTTRTLGADLKLNVAGPALNFGYARSEDVQRVPTLADTERTTDYVSAAVGQGGQNFSYNAHYMGSFRSGTFAGDNADEHRITLNGRADLDSRTRILLTDEFYRRQATEISTFNPHQESNTLALSLNAYSSERDSHRATYTYLRGIQLTPGAPDVERLQHVGSYAYERLLDNPEWRLTASADATFNEDRLGDDERRTAGQSIGGLAQWRRTTASRILDVRGGPTVGILEGGGDTSLGYGASGGFSIIYPGDVTWQLIYDASFASDIGNSGWSARQSAFAVADLALGLGHLSWTLSAAADERDSPLFGNGGTRTFSGRATYARPRLVANLVATVTSGLTNAVSAGGGRGLFLALPYDSHVYSASGSVSFAIFRGLTASGEILGQSTVSADRPTRQDLRTTGRLAYALGALLLSLDDRYAITRGGGGIDIRSNVVLVTVSRSFGGRH